MSNILGIDYGTKIIGVSLATTIIAEPLIILDNDSDAISQLVEICQSYHVDTIVIGMSEGDMGQRTKEFAQVLAQKIAIPIEFHDETLSSYTAQQMLLHAKKSLRDEPQDAFQATVMLQDYLDTHIAPLQTRYN